MAFPHPQSGKSNYWNRDISNNGSVVWKFLKRTINITDYRNGEDNESSEIWNVWWDLSWLVC